MTTLTETPTPARAPSAATTTTIGPSMLAWHDLAAVARADAAEVLGSLGTP